MGTLSTCRRTVTEWLQLACAVTEDHWYGARREIGRRVSTSKRAEIGRLQDQLLEMAKLFKDVRRTATIANAKAQILEIEVDTLTRKAETKPAAVPAVDTLKIDAAERAQFDEIVRGEDPEG